MRFSGILGATVLALACGAAHGEQSVFKPLTLAMQPEDETVYERPLPPTEAELFNQGGVNLDFWVYYGIDRSEVGGSEDSANLQFDGVVKFNLGERLPHPFFGVFVNVYDRDPVSRFQEIRPFVGAELTLRPFIFEGGHIAYIFPNREEQDTNEFYGKITLMDGELFRTMSGEPVLSPYVLAAYDYDIYNGWYFEAGVSHRFAIEGTGLSVKAEGLVSYVRGYELFARTPGGEDTGFQRWEVGVTANYNLNQLLNIAKRYGNWSINGYIRYTDNLDDELRADRQIWGGAGIEFTY